MNRLPLRTLLAILSLAALAMPAAFAEKKSIEAAKTWKGSVEDDALLKNAPKFAASAESLAALWKIWKIAGKPPEVDFSTSIVVVMTTKGSILNPSFQLDEKGNLELVGMATMDYLPGFRYVLSLVPRAGVKTVDGEPLS